MIKSLFLNNFRIINQISIINKNQFKSKHIITRSNHSTQISNKINSYLLEMVKPNSPLPIDTSQRLKELRIKMKESSCNVYIVPSEDQHSNEYVNEKRREYITAFTGSAGTAIILEKEAHLWTDGRYHNQAANELCKDWTLQKFGKVGVSSWQQFLTTIPNARIGIDPNLLAISEYNTILPTLPSTSSFVSIPKNLIDEIWGTDKPISIGQPVVLHDIKYAGQSANSKIEAIRNEVKSKSNWGVILSVLDEIAWTLNLRGSDIAFNPVFFSYLLIPLGHVPTLFINLDQISDEVYQYLTGLGILIEPYDSVVSYLENVSKQLSLSEKILVPSRTSLSLAEAIGLDKIEVSRGPVVDLKAVKNATEIEGFRQAHLRDGIALTRYFSWLESRLLQSDDAITEFDAATELENLRKQLPLFKGLSFTTISSTGENAAIIHYSPSDTQSSVIDKNQVYLCDSGAQFFDGTTDTTRTWFFGPSPPSELIRAYTRVLQGVIAIDTSVFPSTTTGFILDSFARRALWQDGLDYNHGTGHGVGSSLCVHEGPIGLGTRINYNEVKLQAGNVLSNEPGCYIEGKFGIRIENVVAVVKAKPQFDFGNVGWLKFENFTMCPISTKLVDASLLSPVELSWLNNYNAEVREKLLDRVEATGDKEAVSWLVRETKPLVL